MHRLLATIFLGLPAYACSCNNSLTPCSDMSGATVAFLARVIVDTGDGWGTRPARVAIEEPLLNVPGGLKEIEIDSGAGTSCNFSFKKDLEYVVFASKVDGPGFRLRVGGCSNTFALAGNEYILDALRNQARAGTSRLIGVVRLRNGRDAQDGLLDGAKVTARSDTSTYETTTNAAGVYELLGLVPGTYHLDVAKPGFAPYPEDGDRSSSPATVLIADRACTLQLLSMSARGRILGTVTDQAGRPLSAINVQAFEVDIHGEPDNRPIRTALTDQTGKYAIEPLPAGDFLIGVNAEPRVDREANVPTTRPTIVHLSRGAQATNINLTLPPKRVATTLEVEVRGPGGTPYAGAAVSLENLAGVQRFAFDDHTSADGAMKLPVYLGESYIVRAIAFGPPAHDAKEQYDYLEGTGRVDVGHQTPRIVVMMSPRYSRH